MKTDSSRSRRKRSASLLLLALLSNASMAADGASGAAAELQRCRSLSDSTVRLACYDTLAEQASKTNLSKPAPPAVSAADPSMPIGSSATFGLPVQRQNEPDVIKSQIEGLVEGWGPGKTFTLANGQVWQVSDGSRAVLYLKNPKVEIRRAALGTFMLELEGTNETARVKRLR